VTAAGVPNFATIGDPHFDHQTNQYFYRITPSDALQGVALGYWAATHFKAPGRWCSPANLGAQTSVAAAAGQDDRTGAQAGRRRDPGAPARVPTERRSPRSSLQAGRARHGDGPAVGGHLPRRSTSSSPGNLPVILGTQRTSNSDWIQAVLGAIGQASLRSSTSRRSRPTSRRAVASHAV